MSLGGGASFPWEEGRRVGNACDELAMGSSSMSQVGISLDEPSWRSSSVSRVANLAQRAEL